MISKIVLDCVASYKKRTELETDKTVNLIYGLNGTGKSTFSDFLYKRGDSQFSQCEAVGLDEKDTLLVYNQTFVHDNFYVSEDIKGIFTLSKVNTKALKEIDESKIEYQTTETEKKQEEDRLTEVTKTFEANVNKITDKTWEIKKNYTGGDRVLEFCLDGFKGNKETLFKQLIGVNIDDATPAESTIENLKKRAQQLQGDTNSKQLFSTVLLNVEDVEQSKLLSKAIIGNKNSSVATLIEKLGNSDWVNEGLKFIHNDNEICPFCQQKTITSSFIDNVKDFFDSSYDSDKKSIAMMEEKYELEVNQAISYLSSIREDSFFEDKKKDLENLTGSLKAQADRNLIKLRDKNKAPSITVSLDPLAPIVKTINTIIDEVNKEVRLYNQRVADIKGTKNMIKEEFWRIMRCNYDSEIKQYFALIKDNKETNKKITNKIEELDKKLKIIENKIEDNRRKTVNIDDAINNINNGLADIGITDFTIEKTSEEKALYRLRRDHSSECVFQSLSEGEKMVISFLYFIELCKGEQEKEKATSKKIIVIDDPISSLSHIYIFNIGRLIHNEFLRSSNYEQIFILTHSLYFFYELTNTSHKEREETQKLFRLCKNKEGSYFEIMKYEEIQNDYQAYWYIIKDNKQPPALIANCMRNVIEYFFNFVEKQDFPQIFQRKELQETRYMAFNRYMNRESHSKGQNIFDIKEFDYNSFREAFKMVFEIEGYIDHYKKMIGNES